MMRMREIFTTAAYGQIADKLNNLATIIKIFDGWDTSH